MAHLNIPIHGVSEPRPEFETVCAMHEHAVATAPDAVRPPGRHVCFWGLKGGNHVKADSDGLLPGGSSARLRGASCVAAPANCAGPGPAPRARIPTISWTCQTNLPM
jgi:hypothetical protein